MKLYTEEQVISMIDSMGQFTDEQIEYFVSELTPIKIPTDDEINKESMDVFLGDGNSLNHILQYKAFKRGAMWMRDKLQGGEK
jgi:hypothetical protein